MACAFGPLIIAKIAINVQIRIAEKSKEEEEIENLLDHDIKLDAFFFHDYWMRFFSLLFLPTFLIAFIQLNYLG